jgi:hypothetical protein
LKISPPAISHLRPPEEIRSILQGLGFHELSWQDESQGALAWAEQRIAAAQDPYTPPPAAAGLHLILGEDFGPMFANVIRNLREGRLAVIQAVLE